MFARVCLVVLTAAQVVGFHGSATASTCLGNFIDDFSSGSLAPRWTDVSDPGSSVTEAGGMLICTKGDGGSIASAVLTQSYGVICGDFDITVDYSLDSYPAASDLGGRFHGVSVIDDLSLAYVGGIQRYSQVNACVPGSEWYKTWSTIPSCPPSALYYETTDTQGKLRITRTGATVKTFFWSGSAWFEALSTSGSTNPVRIIFQSGTNGSLVTSHSASFDNLSLTQSTVDVPAKAEFAFALDPVRPNPSHGDALTVQFTLTRRAPGSLDLVDEAGRLVTRRDIGSLGAGRHALNLGEGRRFAPGVYFVRLQQAGRAVTGRLCVVH